MVNENCRIQNGSVLAAGVEVKAGVTIQPGSICSLLTYDSEEQGFKPMKPENFNTEYFIKGGFPNIPFNLSLKEAELLGANSPFTQEESDIDISDDESVQDPFDQFS